jgi:hypothetical protein
MILAGMVERGYSKTLYPLRVIKCEAIGNTAAAVMARH